MIKQLGGARLGSGNKMNVAMKNYSRSTHNLTESFRSSMAPGVLYPFYVAPALNGDTFDFDLAAMAKTLPTNGPVMGQFKLQMDMFLCPIRLYQAILHNNPMNIGLNMKEVKLPKIEMQTIYNHDNKDLFKVSQIAPSTLAKYLGISGLHECGTPSMVDGKWHAKRQFSALPFLMYYDIFKNYYANKQEEKAYVISGKLEQKTSKFNYLYHQDENIWYNGETEILEFNENVENYQMGMSVELWGENLNMLKINFGDDDGQIRWTYTLEEAKDEGLITYGNKPLFTPPTPQKEGRRINFKYLEAQEYGGRVSFTIGTEDVKAENIYLKPFDLENIDKMRMDILSLNALSDQLTIEKETAYEPYLTNVNVATNGEGYNLFNMNGLVVKTYQSDIFNNWVNTEWIDGENGINEITTIDTSDGLKLDTLNLAQKVYNMLNRIATCGGTYQDWQEAVYGQKTIAHCESPIYCGGLSGEIGFEEITSSVATEADPLGTLGGKGKLVNAKGGKLVIKVSEPSYIIGIVSITPRLDYCDGNAWYMTEIETLDDFHKPELDGIGFQDLIGERMAWWDTLLPTGGTEFTRHAVGKQPAWLNYMTAYDKVFGDFAKPNGYNYMVLSRNYTAEKDQGAHYIVKDFTTYIDPSKFNYAFSNAALDAQNFWVQILSKVTARRLMSAKIIPNL